MHIQKILYPLSNASLMNFIKFWSLGGALDKGFYGIADCFGFSLIFCINFRILNIFCFNIFFTIIKYKLSWFMKIISWILSWMFSNIFSIVLFATALEWWSTFFKYSLSSSCNFSSDSYIFFDCLWNCFAFALDMDKYVDFDFILMCWHLLTTLCFLWGSY